MDSSQRGCNCIRGELKSGSDRGRNWGGTRNDAFDVSRKVFLRGGRGDGIAGRLLAGSAKNAALAIGLGFVWRLLL